MSAVPRASQILLVGQRIRQLRKSRHLTQADLASRIGITQSDLSRMESGEYKVGLDTLFRILQVFELSMSRFFEEPGESEAAAEKADTSAADAEPGADRELLTDFAQLSDESQREVREFIAFKKQQAASRRLSWPAESTSGSESIDAAADDGTPRSDAGAAPPAEPANELRPARSLARTRRFARHDVHPVPGGDPATPIASETPFSSIFPGAPGPAPDNRDNNGEGGEGT